VSEKLPALVLFARAPVAGGVKTRLAAALGLEGAARLYRAFLEDASRVYTGRGWDPVLYADPDPDEPTLAALFGPPWRREAQAEGDLGRRLSDAFRSERSRGADPVAAVGSDHPALARGQLVELFEAIERGEDAALIPARDGGYCAIALSKRADPGSVFDGVPWSSPSTFEKTLERIHHLGLSVAVHEPAYDVDRPEDLEWLRDDLASRDPREDDYPRATAAALAGIARRSPA
jgi:hypothetical protein